jgi:hypothetical protein
MFLNAEHRERFSPKTLNLVGKTLFTSLSTNRGPRKERPVHSRPNLRALKEGNLSLIMCSMEAYRFDEEVYYVARDRGFKVRRKTVLHAGLRVLQARALRGGTWNFLFGCAFDAP